MFEIKTLKDGLKKIAPRTKTRAITDDANKSLDTILSEKANSTDVPSKVSQLTNDTGFITNAALADYPNNTQMNAAINSHHDSTKQDKLAAQTPYTNVGSKNKIPKITTNALGQVTNVEEVDVETQPANLSQNLTYANDNNTSIVTNVSDNLLLSDGETYVEARKSTDVINNGLLSSVEKAIARFSKDYFNIKNTNEVNLDIDKVLANALLLDGSSNLPTYLPVLNDLNTGIACSYGAANLPIPNTDTIILCGSAKNSIHIQVAFNSQKIFFRISSDGVTWNNWVEYYTNKQDTLTFATTDFNVTNNNVSLNPTKFADYLLKSDAPGYADILTKTLASTTYVSKTEAVGYDDILTKTLASATYETIENASNYVAKGEAVGYDDILTKTEASTIYETKQNASATYETKANATETYETKANASATYETKANVNNALSTKQDNLTFSPTWFDVQGTDVSLKESIFDSYLLKDDAPGYADILTKTLASTTYETKANASNYVVKTEAVGYDDILTKTEASSEYETKANATATYETKANATATYETKTNANTTYVSKTDAVGYDDILTNANASATYETKANASETYVSKTEAVGYDDILTSATAATTYATIASVNAKQDKLVSGTNIKTINNESLLGSGNIELATKAYVDSQIRSAINDSY